MCAIFRIEKLAASSSSVLVNSCECIISLPTWLNETYANAGRFHVSTFQNWFYLSGVVGRWLVTSLNNQNKLNLCYFSFSLCGPAISSEHDYQPTFDATVCWRKSFTCMKPNLPNFLADHFRVYGVYLLSNDRLAKLSYLLIFSGVTSCAEVKSRGQGGQTQESRRSLLYGTCEYDASNHKHCCVVCILRGTPCVVCVVTVSFW